MRSHDIGLDSLAKAMGESIDKDNARNFGSLMNNRVDVPMNQQSTVISNTSYVPKEYPIQGEMFAVKKSITLEMWEQIPPEAIKRDMLRQLAEEMMKSKNIEFTMMKDPLKDPLSRDMVRVTARVFVTPDSQVRLLREKGY